MAVDQGAQQRKQIGPALHFVDHDGAALRQQRIECGQRLGQRLQRLRIFEVEIGAAVQIGIAASQRGLADLARTQQRQCPGLVQTLAHGGKKIAAVDHGAGRIP
jgi:hypothetical protein